MAWLAVDIDGEIVFENEPRRIYGEWMDGGQYVILPEGSIEKLIGEEMTWEDEPVEI